MSTEIDVTQEAKIKALKQAGHPVIRITVADLINLGEQFSYGKWRRRYLSFVEINAFDQPNVQKAKIIQRNI